MMLICVWIINEFQTRPYLLFERRNIVQYMYSVPLERILTSSKVPTEGTEPTIFSAKSCFTTDLTTLNPKFNEM